jgi:hypothetical protein
MLVLDLAHRRASSDTGRTCVCAATRGEAGKDEGDREGCEAEEEEGVGGLRFLTALLSVGSAVGDTIVS